MKIGVNLLWCVPGVVGGSENYLARQYEGLGELLAAGRGPTGLEVELFVLPALVEAHPALVARFPTHVAPVSGHRRVLRVGAESTWLAGTIRRHGFDLVHHGGGTVPTVHPTRAIVTVHDLQYLTFPEFFSATKRAYLRAAVPHSVRRAEVVTVPSAYVRDRVIDAFGVPPERVIVVPHGIPASEAAGPVTPAAEIRDRYGLPGPFVVYPAITYPHKNHLTVVRALAALPTDVRLVLLGGVGPSEDDVHAEARRLGVGDRVLRPGRVSDADRDGLLAAGSALVFPSRYEGFGAPVLEAMRLGCPVIAADATCLPEVVADGGLLVPALDPEAWATAIARLIGDPDERERLVAAGRARATFFTGERSALALVDAYRLGSHVERRR